MGRSILITDELIGEYKKRGYWEDTTISEYCDRNARNHPRKEGVIDVKTRLTWPDVKRLSDYIAINLLERGFKKGDVVLAQLYNCVELYLTLIACRKIGIITSIPRPTFREKELREIAKTIEPVAVITPWKYRNFDYFGMFQEISKSVPSIKHHFVVGDAIPEKAVPFNTLLDEPSKDNLKNMEDLLRAQSPSAFEVNMILTTSGTTGIPKCLEYTQSAQIWAGRVLQKRWEITAEDIIGIFFHLSGATAPLTGMVLPALLGAKVVLIQHWSPQEACELIAREKITVATLAPAQLAALLKYPDIGKYDLRSLRVLHTTMALLPFALAREAEERLGAKCVQTYGSVDGGPITCTPIYDPIEKRVGSVGILYDGVDVRIIDEFEKEVPQGCIGTLSVAFSPVAQGSYYRKPEMTAKIWQGGRKKQEDLVKEDEQGHIFIVGRTQEVINRGGEKIYPKEIEDIMQQHPAVSGCALVKMPDPIMGDKGCLCIVLREGKSLHFEEMKDYLKGKRIANFKIPERLEILEKVPLVEGTYKIDKKTLEQLISPE